MSQKMRECFCVGEVIYRNEIEFIETTKRRFKSVATDPSETVDCDAN
jgi:hypothetical protein